MNTIPEQEDAVSQIDQTAEEQCSQIDEFVERIAAKRAEKEARNPQPGT